MDSNAQFSDKYLKIIESIASVAAYKVDGVASLSQQSGELVSGNDFSNKGRRSIIASFVDGKVTVDISMNIYNGYSIPDLAYAVQSGVISEVQKATSFKIKAVNVNVVGIIFNS